LPIRVYGFLDGNNETLMQKMFERGPVIDPQGWLTIRGIKVYYDGSLGSRTALLRAPYSDKPEDANMTERISPQRVASLAKRAVKHGFQLAVHAIGDEGNDRALNIYENALRYEAYPDHRWRIEHAQVVLPNYYQRVAHLGVISSMQSSHAVGDSGWAEQRVGADRIRHAYAWQNILNAGGKLIMNSDLPGEPWQPVNTLHFAVTRQNLADEPRGGWYADQSLSVMQALKAMTSEGAYAAFQEDKVGSLKPGAFADFVILNKDPRKTSSVDLKKLKILSTWVNGNQVWHAAKN
jgi:predicted amidohydrolase YtcJ